MIGFSALGNIRVCGQLQICHSAIRKRNPPRGLHNALSEGGFPHDIACAEPLFLAVIAQGCHKDLCRRGGIFVAQNRKVQILIHSDFVLCHAAPRIAVGEGVLGDRISSRHILVLVNRADDHIPLVEEIGQHRHNGLQVSAGVVAHVKYKMLHARVQQLVDIRLELSRGGHIKTRDVHDSHRRVTFQQFRAHRVRFQFPPCQRPLHTFNGFPALPQEHDLHVCSLFASHGKERFVKPQLPDGFPDALNLHRVHKITRADSRFDCGRRLVDLDHAVDLLFASLKGEA